MIGGGDGLGNIGNGNVIGGGNNIWGGGGNWFGNGGWGGGYGNWGGGWSGPPAYGGGYYGNWYNGCWNHSGWGGFWAGLGVGALTSWGLNALYNPYYAYSYGMSSYFPTWGAYDYTTWGLESVATPWLYEDYSNPYTTPATQTIVVQQPVAEQAQAPATTVVFDYSKPISAMETARPTDAVEAGQEALTAARESFRAGDYSQALSLTDQALAQTPNDAIMHEFRSLVLFALKRYDESAATAYAVLTAGPGWNWPTMVGLYPDVDTYIKQLRELETGVTRNPNSASSRFLLAYHYMVQGHKDAAASEFQNVVKLEPKDALSAQFAAALGAKVPPPPKLPAQVADTESTSLTKSSNLVEAGIGAPAQLQPDAKSRPVEDAPAPPSPPANLQGRWVAKPNEKISITLALNADGTFEWSVKQGSKRQAMQGRAGYQDQILSLAQEEGPPLLGKVEVDSTGNRFTFKPPGTPKTAAGLSFEKAAVSSNGVPPINSQR